MKVTNYQLIGTKRENRFIFVNMRSNKVIYWIAQLTGWCTYAVLILLATYNDSPKDVTLELVLKLLNLVVLGIIFTHLMSRLSIKLGWLDMKLVNVIPRVIISSFICSAVISLGSVIFGYLIDPAKEPLNFLAVFINILAISVLVLFWNAIYFTIHYFQKSKAQELNNLSLESSKNEIELKNLRSQLNPHFLFNSLNSIRALIDIEPAKAKNSVTTLSNLLRKSLIIGKEDLVSLSTELEMVSHYLELEKMRFEERLTVTWEIDDRLNDFQIPPFCLQMLVENAIKHGISNIMHGGEILICTKRTEEEVLIQVINSGELGNNSDTGIGIANTIRRLDIQFNGKAEFILKEEENNVIATLAFKV